MASAATRLAAAALLALFVAAAAAQAAPKGWSTPTFHKFQSDARFGQLPGQLAASGKASVASAADGKAISVANEADYYSYYGSDRYYKEAKQTCLAETRQYNCAMYGCECLRCAVGAARELRAQPTAVNCNQLSAGAAV